MSKFFKGMFALLLLPLLILLTGCNSEDAFSELTVKLERIDIVALPITTRGKSELTLAKGNEQPFEVIGHYSDSSSRTLTDLSVSNWHLSEQEVGYFDNPRVLIGGKPGQTSITVTKDGITSNTVDVIVCADLEGVCIDIFDTGSGKLFTSSPSVAYLDSIGGSTATNGTFSEYGIYGPVGDFYLFNWNNANALCATYNTNSIGGRTNWRLATRDELKVELYDVFRNMFGARGWPSRIVYWSATPHSNGSGYYFVLLFFGSVSSGNPSLLNYASCVSEP